jgi:hypothetical protein
MSNLVLSWSLTREAAKLCIVVDEDDPELPRYRSTLYELTGQYKWLSWIRVPTKGMNTALNYVAMRHVDSEDIIGFMGDDHRPRTVGWDDIIATEMREHNALFAYANDLLQGANLPTQVAIDSRAVRALGHMAPGELHHLYLDNYWKTLGERTGRMRYLNGVIIEHMHPVAGKAEWDEGYKRVNHGSMYEHDRLAFESYVNEEHMLRDIEKVRGI